MKLLPQIQVEGGAEWLARTATQCLIDEARLSPKPGLVDSRGNGAHHDLSLALMERSAHSLTSTFQALALQSCHLKDFDNRLPIGQAAFRALNCTIFPASARRFLDSANCGLHFAFKKFGKYRGLARNCPRLLQTSSTS